MRWRSPARCLPGGRCRASAKKFDKKGTAVTKNYQTRTSMTSAGLRHAMPETVSVSMNEIAEDMREGLLLAEVAVASGTDRKKLFAQLTAMVKAHETAEEAVVRPVSMQTAGQDVAEARNAEESEADAAVVALSQLDVDSAEFDSQFAAFTAAVSTHAEAEERDEFPTLQSGRSAEQRQRLGREFLAKFAAAGGWARN